jgi:hypothetical protein
LSGTVRPEIVEGWAKPAGFQIQSNTVGLPPTKLVLILKNQREQTKQTERNGEAHSKNRLKVRL